jgi:carbon-monoxide dehydrogenase medium subunit
MYTTKFEYVRASSVDEAIALLGQHRDAKVLAGGHSLLPVMKLRLDSPGMLIDIGHIDALKGIEAANGSVRIGAMTTHTALANSDLVPSVLSEAAGLIGDPQVRNRGTIGGNVAHADPASDLPTVLTALNATFHLAGPNGERRVPAVDFFLDLFQTAMAEGEILSAVEVPAHGKGTGSAYAKMPNPASRYAIVGAAAVLSVAGRRCNAAGVAVGGLTPCAKKTPSVEAALEGKTLDDAAIAAAAEAVQDDLGDDLMGDIHASAEYRRAMAPVYVRRALDAAVARAKR